MPTFNPVPYIGQKYTNGTDTIIIKDFVDNKVHVVFLDESGKETERKKTFPAYQWNKEEFILSNVKEDKNKGTVYTFSILDDGDVIIKNKDGQTVLSSNIKGPKGDQGNTGPQGPKGNDGKSGGYWEPRITDEGELQFIHSITGEKTTPYPIVGKNGEPGKTGVEGKQGLTGPKGEDGIYWFPEISKDKSKLRFVNRNNSTECTEWYDIKGVKGDTGGEGPRGAEGPVGPVFIPSVNADGDLSWSNNGGDDLKNPITRNIKGDKGDKGDKGATFHPIVKDGVLYWYDDNGSLVNGIAPVRITGAQGKQGEQGVQGLSAYQIWLKQGYRGTEQDFLDSLKGEKGTPAPPASFSYKDVKDFKCDVQEIDTNLIIDKNDDTDSPKEIIDKRTKEIEDLREKGHSETFQKKYNVGRFKSFFWRCAGADKDLLTMCPGEHSKYVGIGTVILFTAFMAWFSSFIAMRLVFGVSNEGIWNLGSLGAAVFALFWASMIFFLDRFITNTMYSDGKVTISKEEFFSGLPRITIAIFLGIIISAPLELKIFNQEIKEYLQERIYNEVDKELKRDDIHINAQRLKDTAGDDVKDTKTQFTNTKNAYGNKKLFPKDVTRTTYGGTTKTYVKDEDGRNHQVENRNANIVTTTTEFNEELYIKSRYNDSIAYETAKQRLYDAEKELARTDSLLRDSINRTISVDSLGLYAHLQALHSIATQDYQPWSWCGDTMDTILHAWWWYLFNSAIGLIMLLFILIDVSPVLYKMMLADGNYDNYLHQEKLLAQDKIRLSLSNMLKKLNDSELKRVAPFIMGDIYEKMAGDSYIYKTEEEFKAEMASHKKTCWFWRIWPFSMIRWIFWKEEDKPSAPVIILNERKLSENQKTILSNLDAANKEVFDEVLEMKKKIILASYRRWYKTQHDCIICDDVNDENKAREPFDDEAPEGDDSEIHMDDNDDPEGDDDFMDENLNEEKSKTDDDESDEDNTEDSDSESKEENVTEEIDDDEHELPDDDGDDNPKK